VKKAITKKRILIAVLGTTCLSFTHLKLTKFGTISVCVSVLRAVGTGALLGTGKAVAQHTNGEAGRRRFSSYSFKTSAL